ncbi:MAG: hypothetical protein OEV64_13510 [Desulfobulbaceae bacterium]|nr:hypothetical protein [Desulfobulbaceae bacterium]
MKKGIRTSIDWPLVGAELANCGDDEQIDFFKAFVKECKSWGTSHQTEMQLTSISRGLKKEEKEILSALSYIREDNT